jgi:hypothetical protein
MDIFLTLVGVLMLGMVPPNIYAIRLSFGPTQHSPLFLR